MTPAEARTYISNFHHIVGKPTPIKWVETPTRTITFDQMTDQEALWVASEFQKWELEAGRPTGVPLQ